MENDGEQAIQPTGEDAGTQRSRMRNSIRPGSGVPATVLVADMGDGALLLHGWRGGPSAYLTAADAAPLRRALEAAFGDPPARPS